jgi:hypothetical protein
MFFASLYQEVHSCVVTIPLNWGVWYKVAIFALRIHLWHRCRYASFWEYLTVMYWGLKNVVSYKCWDSWYSANYEDDFHPNSSQWSRTIVGDCRMFHVIYKIQHMTCSEFLMYDYTAWILVDFWKFYFA